MLTSDDDLSRAMTMIDVELSDKDQNRVKLYINNVKQAIMTLIGVQSNSDEDDGGFPQELNYIVDEVVTAKYNKFHNEGMDMVTEEGLTLKFSSDDLQPYYVMLQAWVDNHQPANNGQAIGWE